MYFANPWGLLGLLSLPVIAAIHLYQRRFPPLFVAGAHLWASQTQLRTAGRRRDKLPITTSLLLELISALLLSLMLSEPHIGDLDQVTHLVVVLDNSASMQGKPPDGPSFRDAALVALRQRADRLGRQSVYTVILTGRRPVMLAGPAVRWEVAEPSLQGWSPSLPRHQFAPAWDLARQLVETSGELLFLTDRLPDAEEIPASMEVVSVGTRLENAAISAARWTLDSETATGTVYVRVQNHGRQRAQVEVEGRRDSQSVFRKPLDLPVGAAAAFEIPVPGALKTLELLLNSARDGLPVDNRVLLVEPKIRSVAVAAALPEGVARDTVSRLLKVMPDISLVERSAAQLIVGPAGDLPESKSGLWWFGIGPVDPQESVRQQAKDLAGPFIIDKRNPLVEGVVLGGVVWGGVQPLDVSVTPLISAGKQVLLGELRGSRTTGYLMNIDLARSNLTESPDWPILLTNLVELRRNDLPGLHRWNYRLGENIAFRLFEGDDAAAAAPLKLLSGERERVLQRSPLVELPVLEETGLFEIRDGEASLGQFAINFFDPEESDLSGLRPGRRAPAAIDAPSQFTIDSPFSWAIIIGTVFILGLLFADWLALRPRRL